MSCFAPIWPIVRVHAWPARWTTALVVLTMGALVYLSRSTDPAVFAWLDSAGLSPAATALRVARGFVHQHVNLPLALRSFFSDAAWAFSLGAILADAPRSLLALGTIVLLSHEVAQGLGVAQGTFDVLDLVVLSGGFVTALVLFRPVSRPEGAAS